MEEESKQSKKKNQLTPDSQTLFMHVPTLHSMSNRHRNILGAELGFSDGTFEGWKLGLLDADGELDGEIVGIVEGSEE
jgi:hypothetical protein